jgi:hypothetical protein
LANFWFRPRRAGYGAHPDTWQGWLFLIGFAAAIAAYILLPQHLMLLDGIAANFVWALGGLLLTFVFVQIVKAKTSGEWRWRSGKNEIE